MATLMLTDGLAALVVFLLVASLGFDVLGVVWALGTIRPIELGVAYSITWVAALWLLGLYRLRTHWSVRGEISDVLRATILVLVVSLSILYLFNVPNVSRVFVGMLLLVQPAVTMTLRLFMRRLLEGMRGRGRPAPLRPSTPARPAPARRASAGARRSRSAPGRS